MMMSQTFGVTRRLARFVVETRWEDIALLTGHAGVDEFSDARVRDPNVLALRSKVELIRDPAFSTIAAAVEITTADGRIHHRSQSASRGSAANPMSDAELEDKLRIAAAGREPQHDVAMLIDAVWALDSSADVAALASLAVPRK
jgi:2-methylcitrate dehydratase PrpD